MRTAGGRLHLLRPALALAVLLAVATAPTIGEASERRTAAVDATIVVDDDGSGRDDDPGDGICATTDGDCTLRAALEEAGETSGGGEVVVEVPAGSHPLTSDLALERDVAIVGAGRDATVVDVAGGPALSVTDASLRIEDLELTGGRTTDGVGGSAITGDDADLVITDARIADNGADGDGGAILLFGGSLTVTGTAVERNAGQTGGAIRAALSAVSIADSTFTENGSSAGGGAIHLSYPRSVAIARTRFDANTTVGQGGAISLVGWSGPSSATARITASTFTDNVASADGGALFVGRLASGIVEVPLELTGSTFTGNSAEVGGAVALDLGTLQVASSTFGQNRATAGAGGAVASGGTIAVSSSTFTGNAASEAGGALTANGPTTITGSTFTGNRAGTLGGALDLFSLATPVVTGCTFTDNVAEVGAGAIWRLGTDLTQSDNTFSGNQPEGDDVVVGPAPTSDRSGPTTTTTTSTTSTTPNGSTTTTATGPTTTTGADGGGDGGGTDGTGGSGGGDDPGSPDGGGGILARTGVGLGSLLALSLALLGVGVLVRRSSLRTRRSS